MRVLPRINRLLIPLMMVLSVDIQAQTPGQFEGQWPREAFAGFSDASASTNAFVEALVLANSQRRDIITLQNPGAGYGHEAPEYLLNGRMFSVAPPQFPAPRLPGPQASIRGRQWCLASDIVVTNNVITSLCAGRGNVFPYVEGYRTGSQQQIRKIGRQLQETLMANGFSTEFDFEHFRSLVQAETPVFRPEQSWLVSEYASASALTAVDLNGLADDQFFEYAGGQPTVARARVESVIGMPSNRRDIVVDTVGNLWNRDYRVASDTRASASIPFRVVLRPGSTLDLSNLNARVTVSLRSPVDTTARTAAWLHTLDTEASTLTPCRMDVPGVPYIADLGDCSRIDLLRGLAITDVPVGIDAEPQAWIAATPGAVDGAAVLAATHDWRRYRDAEGNPPEGADLLQNEVLADAPAADEVVLSRQALTLNVDLPLYEDYWVNLFTHGRARLGHHENGLYALKIEESFSILANLEGGEAVKGGLANTGNMLRIDPGQPNADQFAIVTALDSHLAELSEDILPGPDNSNPRIGAAHPEGLLVSYSADNTQPVARVVEPDGDSWFVDLPGPVQTVGVNQHGMLVNSSGRIWQVNIGDRAARAVMPAGAPRLELFPPAAFHVRGFSSWLSSRGRAFFTAIDPDESVIPEGGGIPSSPVRIWISDGTDEGTVPFATAEGGGNRYDLLEVLGNNVLFAYYLDSTNPLLGQGALWVSNGSGASTRSLGVPGLYSLNRSTVVGNRAIIQGRRQQQNGQGGVSDELGIWVTDGTPEQTYSLAEALAADSAPGANLEFTLAHQRHLGGFAMLIGRDPATDGKSLWVTDGTAAGTTEILSLMPNRSTTFDNMVWHDGYLYFSLNPVSFIQGPPGQLWRTDGTAVGTEQIVPPQWGDDNGVGSIRYLTSINGFLAYVLERDIRQELPFIGETEVPRMNLFMMAAEDLHFPVFRNGPILNVSPGAPPFIAFSPGQIGDLTVLNDRLYFVGNGDPNTGSGTVPFHGQELFAFNTERPGLKDPGAVRQPAAGPIAAPADTRPVPLVVFRNGFEGG